MIQLTQRLANLFHRKRVQKQEDIEGLINLLHPRDQMAMRMNVAENFEKRVEEHVNYRLQTAHLATKQFKEEQEQAISQFKKEQHQSMLKMAALPKAEQDAALMLTSMASNETGNLAESSTTNNLGLLLQAAALADPSTALENTAATMSLDQILKMQEVLEAAKLAIQKQKHPETSEQPEDAQATAAAEKSPAAESSGASDKGNAGAVE
jgi:hypothetical protein